MNMNHIPCNLCGNNETGLILQQSNHKYFPRTIVRCLSCGLVSVNPQPNPEDLRRVYQEQESRPKDICNPQTPKSSIECSYIQSVNTRVPLRLRFLKRLLRPGRLLDVGCGTGEFLYYARQFGWEGIGLDISPFAAQRAREVTGLKVHEGTIGDFSKNESQTG